jgi:hypothetical protein
MFKNFAVIGTICLIMAVSNSALTAEESQVVEKNDAPAAVITAFEKSFPDLKIVSIEKEIIEDQTRYEIEIADDKHEKDIIYLEDGTLFAIEEAIELADLPQVVTESLKKAHPKGEIEEAEKITRGSLIEYEVVVEVTEGEQETAFEITIAPSGEIGDQQQLQDDDAADDDDEDESEDDYGDDDEDEG